MGSEESGIECENCGAPLSAPDAVCTRCEPEIEAFGEALRGEVKSKTCPVCHKNVSKFESVEVPGNWRWFRLKRVRLRCPECHHFVRLRQEPIKESLITFAIFIFALGPITFRYKVLHDVAIDPVLDSLASVILLALVVRAEPAREIYEAYQD